MNSLRIANLPSVVSNVWLGIALAAFLQSWSNRATDWWSAAALIVSGCLLYFSGNLFNDWHDHAWDRLHRPERALPLGAFRPIRYFQAGTLFSLAGVLLAGAVDLRAGAVAFAILISIAVYTRWHKSRAWTIIPMGLCRALLPLLGAVPFLGASQLPHLELRYELVFLLGPAVGLLAYITALSACARAESLPPDQARQRPIAYAMLAVACMLMASWWLTVSPWFALLGLVPIALWLVTSYHFRRSTVPQFVSALLAGIPLLDFATTLPGIMLLGKMDPRLLRSPFCVATLAIPWAAFFTARLLQRRFAAT